MPDAEPIAVPSPAELNAMSPDAFAAALRPLFEGGDSFLRRVAEARPFATDTELLAAAHEVAAGMPEEDQIELVNAHPRIGADPAGLSAMSADEQGYPDEADAEPPPDAPVDFVSEELANLNDIYERRFGFRYVVFVAGRPRSEIIPLMEHALRNDRDAELRRGVQDVVYIAGDRLRMMRGPAEDDEAPTAEDAQ
jgi:2-oxo-4-hydroxy-4-carboxy--5-ureidoimidazoline (OHCU) decarboxylase